MKLYRAKNTSLIDQAGQAVNFRSCCGKVLLEVKTNVSDKCYGQDFDTAQNNVCIVTPTRNMKIRVRQVYVSTNSKTVDVSLKFEGTQKVFYKLYTDKNQCQAGDMICALGNLNEKIAVTCGAGTFISISYDEET